MQILYTFPFELNYSMNDCAPPTERIPRLCVKISTKKKALKSSQRKQHGDTQKNTTLQSCVKQVRLDNMWSWEHVKRAGCGFPHARYVFPNTFQIGSLLSLTQFWSSSLSSSSPLPPPRPFPLFLLLYKQSSSYRQSYAHKRKQQTTTQQTTNNI